MIRWMKSWFALRDPVADGLLAVFKERRKLEDDVRRALIGIF